MDVSTRMFQQSLCEGRSLIDNLEPASARLVTDLQRQVTKLKAELEAEKQKGRMASRSHLAELKRLREEHELRLESSLDAQNQRKNYEKEMEIKKMEESLHKERDIGVKTIVREKTEEMRSLERRLQKEFEEKLRYMLEQERRLAFNEAQSQLPDEEELAARENKLAKEVFSLGGENMRLEDQVRHLTQENRSQIELIRRMKREHEVEVEALLRKNKTEAARDSARLRLGEQIIQEREMEFVELVHRAEVAENECQELRTEVSLLKASLDATNKMAKGEKEQSSQSSRRSGNLLKQVEDLEFSVRKLEEEKSLLKQENASLRKKLVVQDSSEGKASKEVDDKVKRLRKRNADLVTLTKTLDERCKVLKQENTKLQDKHTMDNSEVEQQIRRSLSRQHAKDISDYTRKIASRDREIIEIKRKLSKFEVPGGGGANLESFAESGKRVKTLTMEMLRMEKLTAKLYSHLPNDTDVEITGAEFSSEVAIIAELTEENETLRRQIHELRQPSEVDGTKTTQKPADSQHQAPGGGSELEAVRELREENQRLSLKLSELSKLEQQHEDVSNQLIDMQLAASSSEKKLKIAEEDLEQAHFVSQEYERVQEHCREVEREIDAARGQLNEKDRDICQLQLENEMVRAHLAEKEQEVQSLKEQTASLKNELNQGEQLVKELQQELEKMPPLPPDTVHSAIQTSPLYSPKRFPKSSQTSPFSTLSRTSSLTHKTGNLPEDVVSSESALPAHQSASESKRPPPLDLQSEISAAGMSVPDPYDSEVPSEDNPVTSAVSLESATATLDNSSSDLDTTAKGGGKPQLTLLDFSDGESVSLFIACEDYFPLTMSPNPDNEVELMLKKGDYVYVIGELDEVGFYMGQLSDGRKGLVPSNYVTKLTDNPFASSDHPPETAPPETAPSVPPPLNLELTRQFVKDDAYCLAISWEHPKLLPLNMAGYNVYVNNRLETSVRADGESFILLSGIPRNQFVFVSVRTVINGVESSNPLKLVEINPQFPEVPSELSLQVNSLQPLSFRLSWSLHKLPSPSLSYHVYLNSSLLIKSVSINQLGSLPDGKFFVDLETQDLPAQDSTSLTPPLSLTVQASDGQHTVPHSACVELPLEISRLICTTADDDNQVLYSSPSLTSVSNGPSDVTTATATGSDESQSLIEITEVTVGEYYRATYSYDPSVSSPNGESASDELKFCEHDIIKALGELDEDGFFLGSCHGNKGLVPKNMVEHVTDLDELLTQQPSQTVAEKFSTEDIPVSNGAHNGGGMAQSIVQALHDYDPSAQSVSEEPSEELSFRRGDYITVFGGEIDGFYEGELNGQRGYVPSNFVTPVSNAMLMKSLNEKISLQQSSSTVES